MPTFVPTLARQGPPTPTLAAAGRPRRERSPRALTQLAPAPACLIPEDMGYLEVRSVSNEVAMDYYRRLKALTEWGPALTSRWS